MTTDPVLRDAMIELQYNAAQYRENDEFYTGRRSERFASSRLRQELEATGKDYKINFLATCIDVVVERLGINGILCADEKVRDFLNDVWETNQLDFELKDAFKKAGALGDSYIIAWPDEEEETGVGIYTHSPFNVKVFYEELRPRRKSHAIQTAIITGNEDNDLVRGEKYLLVNLYFPDRIEQHVSVQPLSQYSGGVDLERTELRLLTEQDNPYGVVPVYHLKPNTRPYGSSDLETGKGIQDSIQKLLILLLVTADRQGYRQRWMLSDSPTSFTDNFTDAPDEGDDSPVKIGKYQAGPDTVHTYAGSNVKVGEFNISESSNILEPIESLLNWLSKVSDIPVSYFRDSGQALSGISYKRSESPLLKKIESRQAEYGQVLKEMLHDVQLMAGIFPVDAEVSWSPAWVADDVESWDVAQSKVELGVPKKVVLVESGLYSQDDVDIWFADAENQAPVAEQPPTVEDILPSGTKPDFIA